jgi:uncharacterized integral membrane protein
MKFFLILVLILAIALVIFALQNSAQVTLNFLNFHFQGSLALMFIVVFIAGFLAGTFALLPFMLKRIFKKRNQK